MFYIGFFYLKNERIAHVAHQKRATMSDLLRSHTKMRNQEQIAQVAHQKWANEQIACFFFEGIAIRSFFGKKRAIRSGNRWENSQPCQKVIFLAEKHKCVNSQYMYLGLFYIFLTRTNKAYSNLEKYTEPWQVVFEQW